MTATVSGQVPRWFRERRYGMFVHANIATVPAFAPVHEYADWYWAFLEPRADVALHPTTPLPEVVAHHNERWHGYAFDDFIPHLTFDRFDADAYARLAVDAGMGYVVHVTKHHDGFCWWDTAYTARNSVASGPRRDVVAELADATRRAGLEFGTYYSLLDWGHPAYPDQDAYVDAFMRPQIAELVERYRPAVLWGDGQWGHPGGHWRSDRLIDDYFAAADRLGFEGAVNDRFWGTRVDFVTYEYDVPTAPPGRPWELCRGLAHSFCWNRAEEEADHLTAGGVVALLAETVAKGGNLLLNVGPRADGTLPEIQERILRDAGAWVRANADAVHGSEPFAACGQGAHWYTVTPGAAPAGRTRVNAVDLGASVAPVFAELGSAAGRVAAVTRDGVPAGFRQDGSGLAVEPAPPGPTTAPVYRVDLEPAGERIVLAGPAPAAPGQVTRGAAEYGTIGEALAAAVPGDRVELGPGRYGPGESFPLAVPAGVVLAAADGAGPAVVVVDGGGREVVRLAGDGAAIEGITVTGGASGYMFFPPTCVTSSRADGVAVRDCAVDAIRLTGGSGHEVRGNVVRGGTISLDRTEASTVRGNFQHGMRWGTGIEVHGGAGHVVADNECHDDLCAIRAVATAGLRVEDNRIAARWWGVHLKDTAGSAARRNQVWRTMRSMNVEGGHGNLVARHLAEHCDTGVLVEGGAQGTRVADSWLHGCRVGVLTWGDRDTTVEETVISESRDHDAVSDRDGEAEDGEEQP